MNITLYCDASFCPFTQASGWAVWLRSDYGRIIQAGVGPDYITDSCEAELASIMAGVHLAVICWPPTSRILVRNDSQQACDIIDRRRAPAKPGACRLADKISGYGVHVRSRWVKGHQTGSGVDAYLNRRCDQLAGEQMKAERKRRRRGT